MRARAIDSRPAVGAGRPAAVVAAVAVAVVAVVGAALAGSGCGGAASCDEAARHVATLSSPPSDRAEWSMIRAVVAEACTREAWPAEVRRCVTRLSRREDARICFADSGDRDHPARPAPE